MRISEQECAVDIRVASLPECLDEYGARIREMFQDFAVNESAEEVWIARPRLFENNDALILEVSVLPDDICSVSAELHQWSSGSTEISVVAQATGLMTVAISSTAEIALDLLDRLRERVVASGGSVVVLRAPDPPRGSIDVWGSDRGAVPLMREIKRRFDPNRILNPGRFVGNI